MPGRPALGKELVRLRSPGLELIPKLNFSTAPTTVGWALTAAGCRRRHHYKVCGELIAEVAKLFDTPRFFHLGYDEDPAGNQVNNDYVVVRQHEL